MKNFILTIVLIALASCGTLKKNEINYFRGYFSYLADAPIFIDCETNEKYPVAMEGDYLTLEREYLKKVTNGGEKILVTLKGKIIKKDKIEGEGEMNFLVVDKFLNISPNKRCNNVGN